MIMPDGYSVDLDQFHGLDQIGEEGLRDKVNNHYLQIFGTSIALGVISGAGQIESGGGTITTSGSQAFTQAQRQAFRSPLQLCSTASFRFRQRSRSAKDIASRSTSLRTCCCLLTTTTLFRKPFEEIWPMCRSAFAIFTAASSFLWPDVKATRPRSIGFRRSTTDRQHIPPGLLCRILQGSANLSPKSHDENKQMQRRLESTSSRTRQASNNSRENINTKSWPRRLPSPRAHR